MSGNATTDYTSLDVSRRLVGAGFKEEYNGRCWIHTDNERLAGSFLGYRTANSTENVIADAYRADILLVWLLERGVGVYIDKKNGVDYVYPYGADAQSVTALTLPDALAEVVLAILAEDTR